MVAKTLSPSGLEALLRDLIAENIHVLGPAPVAPDSRVVDYLPIKSPEQLTLSGAMPARSIKGAFLPPTEVLFSWKREKGKLQLEKVPHEFPKTVVFGARPCDTAAVEIVDKLMDWDYHDELWFGRRKATTIISFACDGLDESCFCTAVGLGPDATRGADILLTPVKGGYHVKVLTTKGEALVKEHGKHFKDEADDEAAQAFWSKARGKIEKNLEPVSEKLGPWLEEHFNDPCWNAIALRCHGCGACASICPTCHCFDIVDEPRSVSSGVRRRNWDTCQTEKFTLHGSGHNPRTDQNARIRQRVSHKFSIYPKKFSEILCTGCGRCARACPGGMDLAEIVTALSARIGGAA